MEDQSKELAVRTAIAKEKADSDDEDTKNTTAAPAKETSEGLRGDGSLLEHVTRQNFIMVYGCRIGDNVAAKTNMVTEIARIFFTRYDKSKFILSIPDCFEDLQSKDANFEMSVSNTL